MQENFQDIMRQIRIRDIYSEPVDLLKSNTVLWTNGKEYLTVSQMLKSITYFIKVIKENFNVNEYKYSITITYFRMVQLALSGKKARKPEKEDAKLIVDVCHEIANLHSSCTDERKLNEERATALKYLIEILM